MNEQLTKRCDQLFKLKMVFNGSSYIGREDYNDDFNVHYTEIQTLTDDKWDKLITKLNKELTNREIKIDEINNI